VIGPTYCEFWSRSIQWHNRRQALLGAIDAITVHVHHTVMTRRSAEALVLYWHATFALSCGYSLRYLLHWYIMLWTNYHEYLCLEGHRSNDYTGYYSWGINWHHHGTDLLSIYVGWDYTVQLITLIKLLKYGEIIVSVYFWNDCTLR